MLTYVTLELLNGHLTDRLCPIQRASDDPVEGRRGKEMTPFAELLEYRNKSSIG